MRLDSTLLTAVATVFLAFAAAAAQDAPAASNSSQSNLSDVVQGLEDEPAPAARQAEPAAGPPAAAPAEAQPEATPPAPEPRATAIPNPAPAPAAAAGPPGPLTRAQRAELDASVARGRLLGAIARAGLMATTDMLSRVSDPDGAGITGWIAEAEGNGSTVTFYADTATGPAAVYRANILGGRVVSRDVFLAGTRPPLNPIQARMAAARAATAGLDHQVCGGQNFNVFVVPPTSVDGPIDVYQISPQSQRGHFPLGGHFKTSIAANGTVTASRGFTNACLDTAVAAPAAGAPPAPIAVTHLLDPLPQEIHVFLSIWTGHPLVVIAGDPQRLFQVTPDRIAEVPR